MKINISDLSVVAAAKIIQEYCACRYCDDCLFGDDQEDCILHYHVAAYWFNEEGDLNDSEAD